MFVEFSPYAGLKPNGVDLNLIMNRDSKLEKPYLEIETVAGNFNFLPNKLKFCYGNFYLVKFIRTTNTNLEY